MNSSSDPVAVSIFNQLIGDYNGSVAAITTGSIVIAKEIFFALVTISVAMIGINRLLNKTVDATESYLELIRLLIYLYIFYILIDQFPNFLPNIIESFKNAAIYMGNQINHANNVNNVTNYTTPSNPGAIINQGITIATTLLDLTKQHTNFINFGMSLIGIAAAGVILYCFGSMAVKIVIVEISSKILLSGAIFMLAFSATKWTRDYSTRYIGAYFSIGIQLLFTYLLVGIGMALASTWVQILNNVKTDTQLIEAFISLIMATFVYYKICLTLPEQATSYLAGGMAINPGSGPGIMATTAAVGAGIWGVRQWQKNTEVKMEGMTKAYRTAAQTVDSNKSFGKGVAGRIDRFGEILKTLGSADDQIQKQRRDAKVDKTYPGQVAQKVEAMEKEKQQQSKVILTK
ncbi:MAG: type IV secretion system protein [Candidatus Omnitrophica bacterium]|nr:type IV secretion system protein [Candidatus Omnitrophota bacterium]